MCVHMHCIDKCTHHLWVIVHAVHRGGLVHKVKDGRVIHLCHLLTAASVACKDVCDGGGRVCVSLNECTLNPKHGLGSDVRVFAPRTSEPNPKHECPP